MPTALQPRTICSLPGLSAITGCVPENCILSLELGTADQHPFISWLLSSKSHSGKGNTNTAKWNHTTGCSVSSAGVLSTNVYFSFLFLKIILYFVPVKKRSKELNENCQFPTPLCIERLSTGRVLHQKVDDSRIDVYFDLQLYLAILGHFVHSGTNDNDKLNIIIS